MHWIKTFALIWLLVGLLFIFGYGIPRSNAELTPQMDSAQSMLPIDEYAHATLAADGMAETVATGNYNTVEIDVTVTLISLEGGEGSVSLNMVWVDPGWFEEDGQEEAPTPLYVLEEPCDVADESAPI